MDQRERDEARQVEEQRAQLTRDAQVMKEFMRSDAWPCLQRQLDKYWAQGLDILIAEATLNGTRDYWRGRLSMVRDLRALPEVIVGLAQTYGLGERG